MSVIERDPQKTAATLERWLLTVPGITDVEVRDVAIPQATGWSNETILFAARWRLDGVAEEHELVARIAPTDHSVFLEQTFRRQYTVMKALAQRSEVPMARIYWIDEDESWFDSPFWIMERVRGDIPGDNPPYASTGWLKDATPEQQGRAWWSGVEAIARVHDVDVPSLLLPAGTFPAEPDTLGWQLDHYDRYLHWAEEGTPHQIAREALTWLRANRPPDPAAGPSLVWGDARFSNLIYRDFEVAAVLDWEMTALGDPLLDLGWWLFADHALTTGSGCQRLPGYGSRADTAARWSELTGRSADALDYFLVFAGLRFTVIMLRMGKLLCDIGLVPPGFGYDNLISSALADQLRSS